MTQNLTDHGVRTPDKRMVQVPSDAVQADGAATAVTSPKSGVTTTPQAFTVPAEATMFVFSCDGDARYGTSSTLDGTTGNGYKKYHADGLDCAYPCAGEDIIYIRAESGTIEVDFYFERVV